MTLLVGAQTYEVTRRGDVTYVDKLPVSGPDTALEVYASIQPLSQWELQREPEGLRARHGIKIYAQNAPALRTVEDAQSGTPGAQPDVITYQGVQYQITRRDPYPATMPLPHTKYIAMASGTGRPPQ